ncbi:MAG TPA: RsmD family RNA methyltransferase [Polyangiaceae bacterium]|nr:RsmD family RNA methyltransferase [Polyangiaceae bacterium]
MSSLVAAQGAEVLIEKLIPEGKALGHLGDGRVVIATGAVPGDRIELTRVSERKGLVTVHAYGMRQPSRLRVEPRCPVVAQCGGCDWMMLSAEEQRRQKLLVLAEALRRTGGIDLEGALPVLFTGPSSDGYRRRIRLQVSRGRIGFFGRESHELVEPEHCAVSSAQLNAGLARMRALARAHPRALEAFESLELREGADGHCSVFLAGSRAPFGRAAEQWIEALRAEFLVLASHDPESSAEQTAAEAWQRFDLGAGVYMLASPRSFTQVNWEVNRLLIERVLAGARERGAGTFLDAYAGAGNFALPLLAAGLRGVAVEANVPAVLAAREAARRQGLPSDGFVARDVAQWAREETGQRFDLVLLDPPRAGVKHGLAQLCEMARGWLALCSCNPVTLARDLRSLLDRGFELERLEAFDMFPETHHLETLAWLRASQRAASS